MTQAGKIADLFKLYAKDIFGVCYYVLKDENSSMDMVMDTFEVALKKENFEHIELPKAWLMKVAKNLSLKHFHKQKKIQYNLDQQEITTRFMENDGDKEYIYENEQKLMEQIALLKPAQSQCIEMFYLGNNSYQEISESLGIEVKAVKSHIQNGKRNLQIRLNLAHTHE